jgi:hypothetical protein
MKWERKANGDWVALGEHGHFLLWKDGRIWRGLYMHEIGHVVKFRMFAKDLKTLKRMCEENYHWEGVA